MKLSNTRYTATLLALVAAVAAAVMVTDSFLGLGPAIVAGVVVALLAFAFASDLVESGW